MYVQFKVTEKAKPSVDVVDVMVRTPPVPSEWPNACSPSGDVNVTLPVRLLSTWKRDSLPSTKVDSSTTHEAPHDCGVNSCRGPPTAPEYWYDMAVSTPAADGGMRQR